LIGGFYEEVEQDESNKVPFLGDIPAVNLLFKSSDRVKEHTSLVFIVTPKLYDPHIGTQSDIMSHEIHESHILPTNHDYPDRLNPGTNHRSDLRNTTNNLFKRYDPDPPSNLLHPDHPYNSPDTLPSHGKTYEQNTGEPQFSTNPSVTVRSVDEQPQRTGIFNLFGKNKNR
jgi:hypothetical protein